MRQDRERLRRVVGLMLSLRGAMVVLVILVNAAALLVVAGTEFLAPIVLLVVAGVAFGWCLGRSWGGSD